MYSNVCLLNCMNNNLDILFSIVIPTFNRENMINTAIESVLNQEYRNFEIVIIDDGSKDNTKEVISSFEDKRIKYYYQKNKGRSSARNHGIQKSKGEYICFLDDDDYYYPNFLLEFAKEIHKNNKPVGIFMCKQDEEMKNGDINHIEMKNENIENPTLFILENSNNFQSFCTSSNILKYEKFDERFELGEDFHLLFRIIIQYPLYFLPKYLCVYKFHSEMIMENECKKMLFTNLPYNRLDVIQDLIYNNSEQIEKYNVKHQLFKRYNKIAYFYSSSSMKSCQGRNSLLFLSKMKKNILNIDILYYYLSIFFRLPYYFIKCKLLKS